MKHKRAGRKNWKRALSDTKQVIRVADGFVVDYRAGKVVRPLEVGFRRRTLRILDTGFRWLHFAPTAANHALTVQLNEHLQPVQLYVDICDGHGLDPDGVPFVNDLYLDVLAVCDVQPEGTWLVTETEIIDVQELDEAQELGKVTPEQFSLAWAEAKSIEAALGSNTFAPLEVIQAYLKGKV